jgi:hypothetical protein
MQRRWIPALQALLLQARLDTISRNKGGFASPRSASSAVATSTSLVEHGRQLSLTASAGAVSLSQPEDQRRCLSTSCARPSDRARRRPPDRRRWRLRSPPCDWPRRPARRCRRAKTRFRMPSPSARNRPSAAAHRAAPAAAPANHESPHRAAPPGGRDRRARILAKATFPAVPPRGRQGQKQGAVSEIGTADDIFEAVEDNGAGGVEQSPRPGRGRPGGPRKLPPLASRQSVSDSHGDKADRLSNASTWPLLAATVSLRRLHVSKPSQEYWYARTDDRCASRCVRSCGN